ncbi:MAG: BsuBI/PstI family type II restriction endonuclease [Sedimenticola sp.]
MSNLSRLLDVASIQKRLPKIFPEGTKNRANHVNIVAARTIFVMLYLGAIEGNDYWIRPNQVTRMTDEQADKRSNAERLGWRKESVRRIPKDEQIVGQWYSVDSREGIRDDCLRYALRASGAAVVCEDLPTTSSAGRHALEKGFADLFNPSLESDAFNHAVDEWANKNLSKSANIRRKLIQRANAQGKSDVLVTFPNQETRRLAPGPSSTISQAVIEDFAPRFLSNPAVLWVSESAVKEERADRELANDIGLYIESDKHLPDIILVDLKDDHTLIVFVEVVASDGPINDHKKDALLELVTNAGLGSSHAAFVTAYKDREHEAFRRTFATLAWQSFAWCMSEPNKIIGLHERLDGMLLQDLIHVV